MINVRNMCGNNRNNCQTCQRKSFQMNPIQMNPT